MKAILTAALLAITAASKAQDNRIVQLAKLQIDSARLQEYKTILKEGMETALRVEPGVLTLYAMFEMNDPTRITVLEVYADQKAYEAHIASPHFQKYKTSTNSMVQSLELTRVKPFSGVLQK